MMTMILNSMCVFHLLDIGHGCQLFLFLLLGDSRRILVTDLALHADKVGDIAIGVAQGGNKELIPKGRSVDTVIQQTDRHVIALFNGLANAFDRLGVRLGALEEAAIAAENLVEAVASQVEETLTGIDNGIVGQAGIRDDKVLLRRLECLDEGKVGIIQDLVGNALRRRQETIDITGTVLFAQ